MAEFSPCDLANLWVQAGGPSAIAPLRASIAMAESGGSTDASNPTSGACGLWQINPPQSGCNDPMTNAQMAVQKYNTQGLHAWQSYTNGSYQQFYNGSSVITVSTDSSSGGCNTTSALGICLDGPVGLAAIVLGVSMIVIAVAVVIAKSPAG